MIEEARKIIEEKRGITVSIRFRKTHHRHIGEIHQPPAGQDRRQGIPVDAFPWIGEKLDRIEAVHLLHIDDLPPQP